MDSGVRILPYLTTTGFAALAVAAAASWVHRREPLRGGFARAAGLLAAVTAVERIHQATAYRSTALEDASIVLFLASGYALLSLSQRVVPIRRSVLVLLRALVVTVAFVGVAAEMPTKPDAPMSAFQTGLASCIVAVWAACVLLPIVRFWQASRGRPPVQRARLRSLALGYGGIVLVLLTAFFAHSYASHPAFVGGVHLAVLGLIPLLYAAFVPPRWLRRLWRATEEAATGEAMIQLLDPSTAADDVAASAVRWGARLVGGDAAFLTRDGQVQAAIGLSIEDARRHAADLADVRQATVVQIDAPEPRHAVHLPVRDAGGEGALTVLSGRLTPLFGVDEIAALNRFAASIWAAIQHASLVEALREQTARAEAMVQAVGDLGTGLVVVEDARFVDANEAYLRMSGYTLEELRALPSVLSIADPADLAELQERLARRAAGAPIGDHYETALIRKDGRRVEIEVSIKDFERRGRLITLVRDITARKQAERTLRDGYEREREAVARLRTLDEMKSTFLAAVSHELRTPLTAISGFARTLDGRMEEFPATERDEMVRAIARNAVRLERLLSDLLDLDRLQRGLLEPQGRPTDVGGLVRRTLVESELLEGREVSVDAGEVFAVVDPPKVERIVENLVGNAVRHTPADTPIWVRVSATERDVLIVVEDAGPGVPEELRTAIFRPFEQGTRGDGHSPGVGIGLSIVGRFAELHGGRAWVEERPGGGASFRVTLPLDGSERERPRTRSPADRTARA